MTEQEPSRLEPEEAALVARAVEGDAGAYGELYDSNVDRVYRHVLYRVHQVEEAEDITAQVFLNAWQSIHRYKAMGYAFVVWLLRIADNLVFSSYRKRKEMGHGLPEELTEAIPDQASLAMFDRQVDHETLRQALMQLNQEQQRVLVLRFVEDLPSAQVATIMGKSDGAVRVLQYRSLLALRAILSQESPHVEARRAS